MQKIFYAIITVGILISNIFILDARASLEDLQERIEELESGQDTLVDKINKNLRIFGYIDAMWMSKMEKNPAMPMENTFMAGHFAIYLEKQITDRTRVLGQIRFEQGFNIEKKDDKWEGMGELETTQYFIEHSFNELATFKIGKFWTPIGIWNEWGDNTPIMPTMFLPEIYPHHGQFYARRMAGAVYTGQYELSDKADIKMDISIGNGKGGKKNNYIADDNSSKALTGRLTLVPRTEFFEDFRLLGSYYSSKDGMDATETKDSIYIISLSAKKTGFGLEGEYLKDDFTNTPGSENFSREVYYVQGAYDITDSLKLILRYDFVDRNNNEDEVGDEDMSVTTAAFNYSVSPYLLVKPEYRMYNFKTEDASNKDYNVFGIQFTCAF